MAPNILDLVDDTRADADASVAAATATVTQGDLLDIHGQLLGAVDRHHYTFAADVVARLSQRLRDYPAADPRTVQQVLVHLIKGCRNIEEPFSFRAANGWLKHIDMEKDAAEQDSQL